MEWILLAFLLQDKVTAGSEERPIIRATLSGGVDLDYVFRNEAIQQTRSALNGSAGGSSQTMLLGRTSLRLNVELQEDISLTLEIENRSFDQGMNLPFGQNPESSDVLVEQAYIDFSRVLTDRLNARVGIQDFRYRLRPRGEPFFLDLGEAESFFSGAGDFVRNTADRDVLGPVGVTLRYTLFDFMSLEAFGATIIERGETTLDENLYGFLLNGLLSERTSYYLTGIYVTGAAPHQRVFTFGAGFDLFFLESRAIEVFTEIYGQFGSLTNKVDKRAWALLLGMAWYGETVWVEGSFRFRSGDPDPADRDDESFQSYENVNQFAILESALFGLDIDTNVMSFRIAVGFRVAKNVTARIDFGRFRFHHKVQTAAGTDLTGVRDLGYELDATLIHTISPQVQIHFRVAALFSDFVDQLTADSFTFLLAPGIDARF